MIIGSAKCGTTTLADVLASHPNCCFSKPKEVRFFDNDESYYKGWEWYRQAFSHYNGEKLIGEATPRYTALGSVPDCAERIYSFNPHTKIVYIVRHPYKKLISSWKMHFSNSAHKSYHEACQGFEYYLRETQKKYKYLDHCLYDYQLEAYRKLFPQQQILVLFLEDWIHNSNQESLKLCNFLGLEHSQLPDFSKEGSNRAEQKTKKNKIICYLGQASYLKTIRQLIPSPIRKSILKSPIVSKPITYPSVEISANYKQEILNYLQEDAVKFLKRYDKIESFWDFDNI